MVIVTLSLLVNCNKIGLFSDGQICFANASLVSYLVSQVKGFLKASPNATMISVSQNDNLNSCADAEELAVVKAEESRGGPMFRAINTIADAIKDEFPNVLIHTLACKKTRKPPRPCTILGWLYLSQQTHRESRVAADDYTETPPKVTKPRDSVVVQVASSGIGDPRIQAWGKICQQLFVW